MKKLFVTAMAVACVALAGPLPALAETYDIQAQTPSTNQDQSIRATLELNTLQPRVVTSGGDGKLVAAGRLTNTSNRKISDVMIRLQAGAPLASEDRVSDALNESVSTERADSKFTTVSEELEPGESIPVRVETTLAALQITTPGVYPLLFNVNGTPAFGKQARVAEHFMLLPVLSAQNGSKVEVTNPANTTVLWPIVDQPTMLPTSDGTTVLANDDLARSLTSGGRLSNLVAAIENAAPLGSPLSNSLCLVIDPDLVATVAAMANNGERVYRVNDGNNTVEGTGATAAQKWLDRLKGISRGRCVIALPYADADLTALTHAGLTELHKLALERSKAVGELLQIQTINDVAWPLGGALDDKSLAGLGKKTVLLDRRNLRNGRNITAPVRISNPSDPASDGSLAIPLDSLVSAALAGKSAPASGMVDRDQLGLQNGLGVMAFRATALGKSGGSLIVAPPRRWKAPLTELSAFLQSTQQLITAGLLNPRKITEHNGQSTTDRPVTLNYSVEASATELPAATTTELRSMRTRARDLLASMEIEGVREVTPESLIAPLDLGMVRAASGAWRGNSADGNSATSLVGDQLEKLVSQVSLVPPPGPYYLAAADSPLPLTISNRLPVAIRVKLSFTATQGLGIGNVPEYRIGANSNLPVRIPAEVSRSGQFSVDAVLTTPKGTPLGKTGETNRLTLISTAYGTITLGITATAGIALVVLVVLRLVRRLRQGRQDSAAESTADTELV